MSGKSQNSTSPYSELRVKRGKKEQGSLLGCSGQEAAEPAMRESESKSSHPKPSRGLCPVFPGLPYALCWFWLVGLDTPWRSLTLLVYLPIYRVLQAWCPFLGGDFLPAPPQKANNLPSASSLLLSLLNFRESFHRSSFRKCETQLSQGS